MIKYIKTLAVGVSLSVMFGSCMKDLDQDPTIDPDSLNENSVMSSKEATKSSLAKIYATLALTGQKGPNGAPDIQGFDEGTSQFSRLLFYMEELPTDTAVIGWTDPGVPDFHNMNWTASNVVVEGMYYRLAIVVSMANSFINLNSKSTDPDVKNYIAEARFVRAYAYYNLMNLFGDVPITTEVQEKLTKQNSREEVFKFVESELKSIEGELKPVGQNEYGRVDVSAAQALLSRLYLNAEVFIGQNKYKECAEYAEKAIAGRELCPNYNYLFLADNDVNGAQKENIFTINFDGLNSQTWAGTTFLVHAAVVGSMKTTEYGINSGWNGIRTTKGLVSKFGGDGDAPTSWKDKRAIFHTDGQEYEINVISKNSEGYGVGKFKNVTSQGKAGKDQSGNHVDTDLALIRLGEVYLNYAEAAVKGGGDKTKALEYVNKLRKRAGVDVITEDKLTADFVLDERARELYWEGFRRTDLIRNNKFTNGSYLWPFKGGVKEGQAVDVSRNLFPIPENVILSSNGVLKQNKGY